VLEVLYHHAKFGGAQFSPAAEVAKNVEFSFSLSVCLSVRHAFERQRECARFRHEGVRVQKRFSVHTSCKCFDDQARDKNSPQAYSYAEERGIPTVVAKRLDGPRCHLVKRPRPHYVRWVPSGDPAPTAAPTFGPCLLWPNAKRSPISATAELLFSVSVIYTDKNAAGDAAGCKPARSKIPQYQTPNSPQSLTTSNIPTHPDQSPTYSNL